MPVTITSTIPDAIARLDALQARVDAAQVALLAEGAQAVKDILAQALYAHTPVGADDSGTHLRDTTLGSVITARDSAEITVRQTKTIPIKGEDVPLIAVLRSGHAAPSQPITPVTKKALFWHGLAHPVMSSRGGSAAPTPYVDEAEAEGLPLAVARLRAMAVETTRAAVGAA